MSDQVRKALDPYTDGSGPLPKLPALDAGMRFKDIGSYGLRQYSGWIREEWQQNLQGLQAARTYREMLDNSSVIGGLMFAIIQAMRKIEWRTQPANDSAEAEKEAEFADSLREDMSHTWSDHQTEVLSMLAFGFSVHEIVYKRRLGRVFDKPGKENKAGSKYDDGRIGWRRLPIRGQETILKWFLDGNGQVQGVTQQPWAGRLIDLPIEKLLIFRPMLHKNNPEGRSVLRNSYRSYTFIKRMEEGEAIMLERMGGLPVCYVPSLLMEQAMAGDPNATAQFAAIKRMVTNVRIDEQMGLVLPSDVWKDNEGKPSTQRMYDFQLVTPQHGRSAVNSNMVIERYKLDILSTVLADFIKLGHEVRGTNNLGVTKVDMFYAALHGWEQGNAQVYNRYALPRLWGLNALNPDLMPEYVPDMATRIDLDSLGAFIGNLTNAGMITPDEDLENFLRDAAGLPDVSEEGAYAATQGSTEVLKKIILREFARNARRNRGGAMTPKTKRTRKKAA